MIDPSVVSPYQGEGAALKQFPFAVARRSYLPIEAN
jgi:hypothetical protein